MNSVAEGGGGFGGGPTGGGTVELVGARLPGRPGAVDVSVVDGLVAAIRPAWPVSESARGPGAAPRLAAGGRWLVPGFWDEHVHFATWAAHSRRIDVSGAGSAAEVAEVARQAAIDSPVGPLMLAGFRDGLWPDAPDRALFDAAAPGREVVAVSGDLHCAWLSGPALARVGAGDHPTGLLRVVEAFGLGPVFVTVSQATADAWAAHAARAAAGRGVVGLVDLEMAWTRPDWLRRRAGGFDWLRVECGFYPPDLDRALAEGGRTGQAVEGDRLIAVGPLKIISDGSLNTRTAWCFDPYPGLTGAAACGLVTAPVDELIPLMRRAAAAGLTPAVHAIGDRANAAALDAFEAVGRGGRIEHAQLLRWADIDRFARLGVVASVQPVHALDDRDVADRHFPGRTDRAYPLASLLAAGAQLAFGSDAPVAPLDPWAGVAAAVSRTGDGRPPWHPEQRIGVRQAIAASARGRGQVETGMVADLQLVERDPLAAPAEELRTMPVAATWVAGRATHSWL
ncbi:MAG: amidohydrolase family protein [Bifidobacteriaceae bacterium]|jgi:predicted amidohydrolase YtcJ|nr:amidohydrolase family protein [Bifidobacteriaceae bacterium]